MKLMLSLLSKLVILFFMPMEANAHSQLVSSSPQKSEALDLPPTEIVMEFKSPTKLIKVDLTRLSKKQEKTLLNTLFGSDDGEPVALGTSFLMIIDKRQVIPLPFLGGGSYLFAWRAMGEDGHVIKGNLTFNIKDS